MFSFNNHYVVGAKKTYKTKKEFINELSAQGFGIVKETDINTVWLRYSPLVENEYTGKGSYVLTKPNKKGSFDCWEYQHK